MSATGLRTLVPLASPALLDILDEAQGTVQPPIRSEIFGALRFAMHGRSLAAAQRAGPAGWRASPFFPRLRSNIGKLRQAYQYIGVQAATGYDISPAAEWLLENFHLIDAQLKEVQEGLPLAYFRTLPVLLDEPLAGMPRVYAIAWAFVAHTDGAFDEDLLKQFLGAYQEAQALNLSEMWALPTTLRVVLIENLRRLAERVATNKAAREVANLCCDRIDTYSLASLDALRALLAARGAGPAFMGQMAQRLRDRGTNATAVDAASNPLQYQDWLQKNLPDPAATQAQQGADQAADNLSVSNAVNSLRAVADADWLDIVARTSALMGLMLTSPFFEAESVGTRDQILHGIERLARTSGQTEVAVATALLALMCRAGDGDVAGAVARYWLWGAGRPMLDEALGLPRRWYPLTPSGLKSTWKLVAFPLYAGAVVFGSLGLVHWMLPHAGNSVGSLVAAVLLLLPASEAIVTIVNRLISESAQPTHLPRLALINGIPPEHRVLVVIPALLTSATGARALAHRLQLHHLANPERHAQFALLTDWTDAPSQHLATDADLLAHVTLAIGQLNARYPALPGDAPRFIVLHRDRMFSETEQCWIGWERKRGKLEQLVMAMAEGSQAAFADLGEASRMATRTPYVVTLDSDTQLPPGRLRELVGLAAHPHNVPRLDASGHSVVRGYGILQPRVVTPLPAARDFTPYHWLFAGQSGNDPYSAATSEVYQDVFGEGTFTGKGLLHVGAMHAVLKGRLPDGQVLSHDLLEGSLVRCAAVTDITLIEDAPFHSDVAAARMHRWTRGDWQLLPFLLRPARYRFPAVNRWKIIDNLRRSLVPPASLALLVLALAGVGLGLGAALAVVLVGMAGGPLMGSLASLSIHGKEVARLHFYRLALTDVARALGAGLWLLAQLLHQSLMAMDAIGRALYRTAISRRNLLQWTTAEAAGAAAQSALPVLLRRHWSLPVVASVLLGALVACGLPHPLPSLLLCAVWGASPVWTWWASRPWPASDDGSLSAADHTYLQGIARDTWRFFERCVGAQDNHLPPDNLQTTPYDIVAHRTSPTNIGLYLLGVACARQFGWISTPELLARIETTLASLAQLTRHRGHFLNWYDTLTMAPLLPMYVSTVDSGNLCAHLNAVAQACRELALKPHDDGPARKAAALTAQRIDGLRAEGPGSAPAWREGSALARLLAMADPLGEAADAPAYFAAMLKDADEELVAHLASRLGAVDRDVAPALGGSPADHLAWCLADHLATLRSALLPAARDAATRLTRLADACEQLAGEADFSFLYHRKRRLLHIGYRVAEHQLDAGFYDLLASESRLTSLLAIAKGDVPVGHWAALGRVFFPEGAYAGLRSWSGSMFEYLMPTLVLDEPHGSVLREASLAALREQVAFAHTRGVPWGISESAYAGSDHTLAYQYAPQGVPRLALRRTPVGELVIAPYATALAAQLAPEAACLNFKALEALAARRRYGFIEALDFTPARQTGGEAFMPVNTFMAHHHGMSIVALANVLLGGPALRWGMAHAQMEAVSSLMHERHPREVSRLYAPPASLVPQALVRQRAPGLLRDVSPGATALEPTHILSNGRYSVTLRANGAGTSRWGPAGITRTRDDALRDQHGSFFYLRWDQQPRPVSVTQHPAPDPAAEYTCVYHADRVCFEASWPQLQAHTTVWVSPEDDMEFRQVELRNLGNRTLDIELMSAFEVSLSDARADEAHPAFTNLFVSALWHADHQALLFERKPRLAADEARHMAHFLAEADPQVIGVRHQVDRQRWLGRNRSASHPLANFHDASAGPRKPEANPGAELDTGFDPVCAMAVRLRIAPYAKARLTFATAAAGDRSALHAMIDKYRQASLIRRASLMSATLNSIRLRAMRMSPDNFAAIQTLTTALALSLTRPYAVAGALASTGAPGECDRRLLWRFGISGDHPILLVSAGVVQGLGLLTALAQGMRQWAWGGVPCDLVVVNSELASYAMPLQHALVTLRERYLADCAAESGRPGPVRSGFHLLRSEEISAAELGTLQALARVRLNADGRPLTHHVQEWSDLHEEARAFRQGTSTHAVASAACSAAAAPAGQFDADSGEFRFDAGPRSQPLRPWINVIANASFGGQISEAGGGYTWAVNSRMNQLTAWSNDPVADPPAEWFLLQDLKTLDVWSVAPGAWGDASLTYRVAHGQGYSNISHRRGDVDVAVSWCVDTATAVKQVLIHVTNRGHRAVQLRVIGIAEWMMGANRSDRATVHTALFRTRRPTPDAEVSGAEAPHGHRLTALLATQQEQSGGFGGGTAFLALAGNADGGEDWTCDRRECFDARGRLVLPDHWGQQQGSGLDPCAALSTRLVLPAGASAERVFLLGYAASRGAACELATRAAGMPAGQRMEQVQAWWDALLGATTVKTPDPLFDAMVNRWLLYQTVVCRLWSKAGFYQAGGATGYRDQLQDSMALAWAAPGVLRAQIVLCASRQFVEGDVQHWWHAPSGAGVRTHFSDDLLWLPFACTRYLQTSGDRAVLDQPVAFIDGVAIPQGAEDAYYVPVESAERATVYEHAARAIDRSLRTGAHGLPLMGTGDWNDGMNRVGSEGRGESVWLGWFLCALVADWAPLALARGESERAQRWEAAAQGWKLALEGPAWDGQWYRRAFFDDGQVLGSAANAEARIDLLVQAWAVLSHAASPERQQVAMAALDQHLVDAQAGLVKLLTPPLAHAEPSAGYIQAYPPGVRENGGQYAHAGAWALMAQAELAQADKAYQYFCFLSPAHRASHPVQGPVYGLEPYVMAGDVCTEPPHAGRGGWSWYTGAAGWMHRAAVESIFGLTVGPETLRLLPCLPSHWPRAELTLRREGRSMRFILLRGTQHAVQEAAAMQQATLLEPGAALAWPGLAPASCFVVPLPESAKPV